MTERSKINSSNLTITMDFGIYKMYVINSNIILTNLEFVNYSCYKIYGLFTLRDLCISYDITVVTFNEY